MSFFATTSEKRSLERDHASRDGMSNEKRQRPTLAKSVLCKPLPQFWSTFPHSHSSFQFADLTGVFRTLMLPLFLHYLFPRVNGAGVLKVWLHCDICSASVIGIVAELQRMRLIPASIIVVTVKSWKQWRWTVFRNCAQHLNLYCDEWYISAALQFCKLFCPI
jgi:hypothetical protein